MYKHVFAVLALITVSSMATANLISDGNFDSTTLNAGAANLNFSNDNLNKWYTYSTPDNSFYKITEQGYVSPAVKDQLGSTLVQIIEAPQIGNYNFEFDYRLSDDSDMFSTVKVFGIKDDNSNFSVELDTWNTSFTDIDSVKTLYDQGGEYSFLPSSQNWTNASSLLTVEQNIDYIAICSAFSYDGTMESILNEHADIDNFAFSAIPEPATLAMLSIGCLLVFRKRK